jgi:hypothetical protein
VVSDSIRRIEVGMFLSRSPRLAFAKGCGFHSWPSLLVSSISAKKGSPYHFVELGPGDTRVPSSDLNERSTYILVHGTPTSPIPIHNIVGWHTSSISLNDETEEAELDPRYFKENHVFSELLHLVIGEHIHDSLQFQKKARETKSGWLNVYDNRSRFTRAVPSEDIFGTVHLNDGAIERNTYSKMPTHRLYTDEGIFVLDSYLEMKLAEAISVVPKNHLNSWYC